MKTCKQCDSKIEPKPHANNVKFCSVHCRNKYEWFHGRKQKSIVLAEKKAESPAPNKVQCLICKRHYRKVGAHVVNRHEMTARQYREEFGLEVKRGILTEVEREPLRKHVFSNGTVENLKKGKPFRFKKGDKVGRYVRSKVTIEKLQKLYTFNKRKLSTT